MFEHVEIWQSKPDDMLLLCSNRPFSYTAEGIRRRIAEEPYRTALAVAWRATRWKASARYVAGERMVEEATRDYARCLKTDDHNRIEYGFARTLGRPSGFSLAKLHERASHCSRIGRRARSRAWIGKVSKTRGLRSWCLPNRFLMFADASRARLRIRAGRDTWRATIRA